MVFGKKKVKTENKDNLLEKQLSVAQKEIEKEIILNVPNSLTLLRIILAFVFIYMLFEGYSNLSLLIIFAIAALTDWFDGFFARKLKQTTKFGARLDQVVDRIFTVMIVGSIVIFLIGKNNSFDNIFTFSRQNTFMLLFLSMSREIIGLPGVIIALFRKKGTYRVKYIGKVTTFIQSVTLGAIILDVNFAMILAIITCIIGIFSGFDYLKYSLS